jgi:hypothetical protein
MHRTLGEHHPGVFPLGSGSHASRPLSSYSFKERFRIERRSSFEHDVHGTPELLCDDGKGLGVSVCAHQFLVVALGLFIAAKEETGCLADCPFQVDIADLWVFSRFTFTCRLVSALHQPCAGDEVADPWEAVDAVDFVEDHQGEDFPDAGDGAKEVNGYGIMVGNVCADLPFDSEDLFVKSVHECAVHPDGGTDHRVGESVFYR